MGLVVNDIIGNCKLPGVLTRSLDTKDLVRNFGELSAKRDAVLGVQRVLQGG